MKLATVACGLVFLILALGYMLVEGQRSAERGARQSATNVARLLATDLESALTRIDSDTQEMAARLTAADFAPIVPVARRRDIEAEIAFHSGQNVASNGYLIANSEGKVVFPAVFAARGLNVADRPYLKNLRDDPSLKSAMSAPVVSRITGQPAIALAVAVRDGGGRLLGIVASSINLSVYGQMADVLDVGPNGLIAIRGVEDGRVFFRHPDKHPETIGKPIHEKIWERVSGGDTTGADKTQTVTDGQERLIAFERLKHYPVFVTVGVSPNDYESDWRQQTGIVLIVSTVGMLLLAAMFLRQLDTQRRLVRTSEFQAAILENAGEAIIALDAGGKVTAFNRHAEDLLGYLADEVIGTPSIERFHMPAELRARSAELTRQLGRKVEGIGAVLAKPEAEGREVRQWTYVTKSGDYRTVKVTATATALHQADPDLRGFIIIAEDITERIRADRKLREADEKYRLVVSHSEDWVFWIRPDGTFAYNSPSCEMITGYRQDEFADQPDLLARIIHPADQHIWQCHRDCIAGGGSHDEIEFRIIRQDGGIRWIGHTCQGLMDDQGWHRTGKNSDITARKLAEVRLHDSARFQEALLESIPVPVFFRDVEGHYLGCNRALLELRQITREQFVGKTVAEVWGTEKAALLLAEGRELMAEMGVVRSSEAQFVRPDGDIRDLLYHKAAFGSAEGIPEGVIVAITDITDQKAAEEKLQILSLAVEQSPDAIILTDTAGRIEYVNRGFQTMTGYTADEAIGQTTGRLFRSGQTPESLYADLWARLAKGQPWTGEFVNIYKDGAERTVLAHIWPIHREGEAVSHYLAIEEDVTEDRRLALELEEHRSHLEDLVESRTLELTAAKEGAEAANRAKSTFVANMSHEIRTPMNAIIGLTSLLRRGATDPEQSGKLERIYQAATHLLGIINDILDLSKIEAGKLSIDPTDFDLTAAVSGARTQVSHLAAEKGLPLTMAIDPALPKILHGDSMRLTQCLVNYLNNAIKFTEQGTVTLRVALVEAREDDLLVRFEVEDTGIGISEEARLRLFQDFEQADASISRKFGGTGLGLAIVRRLALLMGGEVGADSEPGRGSRFWFTATMGRGAATNSVRNDCVDAERALATKFRQARILLAEDNRTNQEVVLAMLDEVGLSADVVGNGAQAVTAVRLRDYDLILMDMQMPEMDGLEATREIRQLPGRTVVPIVAMTANAFADDRRHCLEAGMNDHLGKPITPEMLYTAMANWLSRAAAVPMSAPQQTISPAGAAGRPDPAADVAHLRQALAGCAEVDLDLGLRQVRRPDRYLRILVEYADTHARTIMAVRERLAAGDQAEARRLAHSIKGASAMLGVVGVQEPAARLEKLILENGPSDEIERLMARVEQRFSCAAEAIGKLTNCGG